MDWTRLIFDLIDLRSFSNLWYWIALAVTWSTASHWVLGVPYDMVLRARRVGGQAEADLEDLVRINVNRILYIVGEAGLFLMILLSFTLTTLALLGFVYKVEFCQALFLIGAPMTLVAFMSVTTARHIEEGGEQGEALQRRLSYHRLAVQVLGMISIFVTAVWGMLQNFNISVLPG
ncbi:component of SufBCD complex [Defluviimonas aestuarii]|uniref:component of SufBCD complex n=1 Tax=Albidovulum aestuarii TaxID=1130726 RepID=UPI00249BC18C|nr:component of SufBCD complex [Defluviimonas aestuarii]MDI3337298.1 component of SufBCD complex [Defluviimonas aestuarii]